MISFAKKVPKGEIVKAKIFALIIKIGNLYGKSKFYIISGVFIIFVKYLSILIPKIIVIY